MGMRSSSKWDYEPESFIRFICKFLVGWFAVAACITIFNLMVLAGAVWVVVKVLQLTGVIGA